MVLRWAECKEQSAWVREQSEKKKLKAQSSKSKVLIDFIGVGMSIVRANSTACITQRAKCIEHRVEQFLSE